MNRSLIHIPLCLVALAMAACADDGDPTTGTHIGNPGDLEFRVSSALTADDGALELQDLDQARFALAEARIVLRDIELDLPDGLGCEDLGALSTQARCDAVGHKVVVAGPFVVDLLGRTSTPSLDGLVLPGIAWRRIDFRIDDARSGLLPFADPLAERSLFVRAWFDHDGSPTELRVQLRFNEDARVEARDGLIVTDGGRLVVDFDVALWLQHVPLTACIAQGELAVLDGVVTIDDDDGGHDCGDLEAAIKQDIKDSAMLLAE